MIAGQFRTASVVVPCVRVEIIVEIIFVGGTVPRIGATARDDLDLGARGAIEIGCLVGSTNLKFLDAIDGRGHHTGGRSADLAADHTASRVSAEARSVDLHAAVHIIRVLTAIQQERALINYGAGDAAVR